MTAPFDPCPFGPKLERYWARLSPLERQMRLTGVGLYSLALQEVMDQIAERTSGSVVLDAFCGAGGSAIGFARAGKRVIAVDTDEDSISAAEANAALFEVAANIEFRTADAFEAIASADADAIFLDPPWGGPAYSKLDAFRLANFDPDGTELISFALKRAATVIVRLPRNFDFNELKAFDAHAFIQHNRFRDELLHFTCFLTGCGSMAHPCRSFAEEM